MNFSFLSRKKSTSDLVKSTLKHISILASEHDEKNKSQQKVSTNLAEMKFILYGDQDNEPKVNEFDKLVTLLFEQGVWLTLITNLKKFEFEAKKDTAQLFMFILRRAQQYNTVQYFKTHSQIISLLASGYDDSEIALHCGGILRECLRHAELAAITLKLPLFELFFDYVQKCNFDVASDAFTTFKMMLTKHKQLAASFLNENYDRVFSLYNRLIVSDNYVTKRQSLKLLGEVILDRSNFQIMMRYINDPGPILEILLRNQAKLIDFLTKFQTDKDTEQFNEEKSILLATLKKMKLEDLNSNPNKESQKKGYM